MGCGGCGCGGCGGCASGCSGAMPACGGAMPACGGGACGGNMGMMQPNAMMQQQMAQMSSMMMPMMMGGGGGMGDMSSMMKKMQEMMGMGSKSKEKGTKKKSKDNANVVFVGGLRKTTEEDRVAAHFAKFGQVEHVDIKRLPDGTSRGFAFIKFADTEAVDKVIEAHAKHMIDNKWVEVKKHDGVAASAGITESIAMTKKKDDDEPEEEDRGDYSEKWSQQYLEMASKLGEMEGGSGGGEKKSSSTSQMEDMMKQMGLDPAMMKQMGMDPKSMQKMMKQMGLDPSMLKMMGMDPSMMMMNMMSMMNPMMGMMGGMGGGGGMNKSMMKQMGMDPGMAGKSGMPALDSQPKGSSPARGRSASRHRSRSPRRDRSGSRGRRSPSKHRTQEVGGKKMPQTLAGMLSSGAPLQQSQAFFRPQAPQAPPEDPAQVAARKAAASAAAAAFAMAAGRVAETSRDAARDAATAKAAAPHMAPDPNDRRPVGFESGESGGRTWHPDPLNPQMKPPVKLWLPEPTVQEQYMPDAPPEAQRPPPPPPEERRRSPRRKSRSKTPRRNRKRGGGWDNEEAPPAVPAPSSFTAQAAPSRPALPPGAAPPMLPGPAPSHPVPVNRFGIPEATPEALAAAVFRAQQVEAAGLEAIRGTGQIPRGPPDLPTGTEVIEQKCVAYLIGKGGQALAAINAAAGVSIQIDQSTKSFGWSMANIYGTEEGAAKAKMILRQKVSEYRPLRA